MVSFAGIQSIIQSAAVNKPTVESTTATAETDSVDPFTEVANVADFAPVSESTQESEDANTSEADTENFINSSLAVSSFGGIDMPKKYSFLHLSIIYFLITLNRGGNPTFRRKHYPPEHKAKEER